MVLPLQQTSPRSHTNPYRTRFDKVGSRALEDVFMAKLQGLRKACAEATRF